MKALILIAMSALLHPTEAQANNATAPVNCSSPTTFDIFQCPKPTPAYKIATELIWALWNFAVAGYWLWMVFTRLTKHKYLGPFYCVMIGAFLEGMMFTFKTVWNFDPSNPYIVFPWGMALQMFNGVALWMWAFFFSRVGWQWTKQECITRVAVLSFIATLFAIAIIVTLTQNPSMEGLATVRPIFLIQFEPPQLLLISFAIAAAGSKGCEPCNGFSVFAGGMSLLWGAHLVSMGMQTSKNEAAKAAFFIAYIPLQLLGSGIVQCGMTKIMNDKEFEHQDRSHVLQDAGINLQACVTEREERENNEKTITRIESPEDLYTYGVFFVLLGYLGSTMCLFFITKPDFQKDPVFRLYGTLHPCILLDYLPGTLFAQPMFGAGILISQYSMLVALFRTAAYGDAIATLLQAMLFGWYWLVSAFFILVFTFNPGMTTVLLHSVPYMIMNICNAFFVITTIVIMFRWKGLNGKVITTICGVLYSGAIIYGTFFMSGKLMSDAGMNLLDKSSTSPAALNATAGLEAQPDVELDPGPMILTLIAQAMILSFGYMSPLRHRPLAFEIYSRQANVPTKYVGQRGMLAEAEGEKQAAQHASFSEPVAGARNFRFQLKPRTPFAISMLLVAFALASAWEFDRRIHPDVPEQDYREIFRRQPGAAIVAVGWMIIANFLVAHLVLVAANEWYTNDNCFLRYWVPFAALLLAVCALVAHAGTIPNQVAEVWYRTTDWFKGVEAFIFALAIWLFTDAALCVQTFLRILAGGDDSDLGDDDEEEDPSFCERFLKEFLLLETILGVMGGIALILVGFHVPSMGVDAAALALIVLFSFCDARGVEVILATMRVATPTDLLKRDINGDWHLPAAIINSIEVPEYDCEEEEEGEIVGKGRYEGMVGAEKATLMS